MATRINLLSVGVIAVLAMLLVVGCAQPQARFGPPRGMPAATTQLEIGYDSAVPGQLPPGFVSELTNQGDPAKWIAVTDPSAPGRMLLKQASADAVNKQRYPLCIYQPLSLADCEATVRIKPLSGKIDQSGGIVVRYIDKDNYYTLRANTLESNVRLYKLEKGKRILLAGIPAVIAPGRWHTLTLLVKGDTFICTFDDKQFEATDATFPGPGKLGFWTKADAVTLFDRMTVKGYDRPAGKP